MLRPPLETVSSEMSAFDAKIVAPSKTTVSFTGFFMSSFEWILPLTCVNSMKLLATYIIIRLPQLVSHHSKSFLRDIPHRKIDIVDEGHVMKNIESAWQCHE